MKNFVLIIDVLLQSFVMFGAPNWTVNSSDFEYSLTMTVVVDVNDVLMGADDDLVGAFVDGECRGVAKAEYNSTYDKYFYYLTVFSNEYSDEKISFKYYNNADDITYTDFATIDFKDGENMGSASSPYIVTKPVVGVDATEVLKLTVYPNPASDMLTINTLNGITSTTIYNVVGKIVYQSKLDIKTVDVSVLQNGVYFIETEVLNKRYITQFIKE